MKIAHPSHHASNYLWFFYAFQEYIWTVIDDILIFYKNYDGGRSGRRFALDWLRRSNTNWIHWARFRRYVVFIFFEFCMLIERFQTLFNTSVVVYLLRFFPPTSLYWTASQTRWNEQFRLTKKTPEIINSKSTKIFSMGKWKEICEACGRFSFRWGRTRLVNFENFSVLFLFQFRMQDFFRKSKAGRWVQSPIEFFDQSD